MEVRVEVNPVAKGLDDGNHSRHKVAPGNSLKIADQRPKGRAAEFSQQLAVILEEDPQYLGNGEDDLAMGDIQEKLLSHPLALLLKALGMTGGTKPRVRQDNIKSLSSPQSR